MVFTAYEFVQYVLLSHQASRDVTLFMRHRVKSWTAISKEVVKLYDPWYVSD